MENNQHLNLTLTDDQGIIIASWTIGNKIEPEFDFEDLKASPKYDFYIDKEFNNWSDIGDMVMGEAERMFFDCISI